MKNNTRSNVDKMLFHRALTAVTIAAAIAMLIFFLDYNGFWIDELYTLHSIRLGWWDMVLERMNRGHFPGYFAIARLWFALWPERLFETALRSLSVIFYMLALASFWPLARKILSTPASLVAVALFACNEVALRQASEARMYTVVLFIAVWIIRAWYEIQQPGASRRWSIALPVLTMIGFMISATISVLICSMLIVALYRRRDNPRMVLTLVISLALGLIVFIPGAIFHLETAKRLGISSSKTLVFLGHIVALMPGVQIWDDYYQIDWRLTTLLITGAAVTFYVIAVLWKRRRELSPELRKMAVIAPLPLVVVTLAWPLVELFELSIMGPPRYFLTLMPMAAILGGWGLMHTPKPRHRVIIHAALSIFLLVSAWTILTTQTEKFRDRVTGYFAQRYRPGDGLIVTPHEIEDGVELYVRGAKVDQAISRWLMDENEIRARLHTLSDRDTVWLVWYRGNESPVIDVAQELWGPFQSNRSDDPYGSLRIYKFTP